MKRRKALEKIGLGVAAGLTLPASFSSCKPDDPGPEIKYDGTVAIIGAGAAGLYAADILQTKGIKITVFEASDQIGGRIRSVRLFEESPVKTDFPIELGAERIPGTDSLFSEIVDRLNIPTVDLNADISDDFILDNAFKRSADVDADSDVVAARNFLDSLSTYAGGNVSVQQAIQNSGINTRVHAILNSWIGNKFGTANTSLSVSAVASALNARSRNEDERTLRSNSMLDVLASRFSAVVQDVELNSAIKNIDHSGSKVRLTGERKLEGGTSEAIAVEVDKVIVTVPVAIIKSGGISFSPSLPPSKTGALSLVGMDACIRVVLDFKQNFWGTTTRFIYGGTQVPEYFTAGYSRSDFNKTLSLTINGPKAEELSALGDDMIPLILGELDAVFDGKATLNIRRDSEEKIIFQIQDWLKEPFIKGGVSYSKNGGTHEDRLALAEPVGNLLFFAGEACDIHGEHGTINGALLSAEHASQQVVDAILAS